MAEPMSDEELYQLTGSWEAAAALRDQQRAQPAPVVEAAKPATLSATPTLAELKAMYDQLGANQARENYTEQGTSIDYIPVQYGGGWSAWEKAPVQIGQIGDGMDAQPIFSDKKELGGFSKQEGDYVNTYDLQGNLIGRQKWNESTLKTMWNDLGPIAMAALTGPGGVAGSLGSALFGLEGAAASAAGGALGGGFNAAMNDQNILKGALLGGATGAGSAKLADILGAEAVGSTLKDATVGDVSKAISFAQNPTLAGAANLASPYVPNFSAGDISLNDVLKNVGTAQALASGDERQIFKALTGMAKDAGSTKSSLAGFEANPEDFIEGYFQPGGEGYLTPSADEMTVREEPENIDALLRSLSPYQLDGGTSVFAQGEDIPEMGTTSKRPITSMESILGNPDILQTVEADLPELTITGDREKEYVPGLRTKDIVSDIPDFITQDQIDKLNLDTKIEDILQTITPGTKVVTPTGTVTPTTGTQSTQKLMANLGLGGGQQAPVQDPYAQIKLMEEMFGPDIAYKLTSLNAPKNLASTDLDALARLLRG